MSKETLLENMNKIHTTELGKARIKKNLKLEIEDVVDYIENKLQKNDAIIYIEGKNYYCEIDNIIITINKYSFTIITAHIKVK